MRLEVLYYAVGSAGLDILAQVWTGMRIYSLGPAVSSLNESRVRQYRITLPTSTKVLATTIAQGNAPPDNFRLRKILTGQKPAPVHESRTQTTRNRLCPTHFLSEFALFLMQKNSNSCNSWVIVRGRPRETALPGAVRLKKINSVCVEARTRSSHESMNHANRAEASA
jgi:hypothetical protein